MSPANPKLRSGPGHTSPATPLFESVTTTHSLRPPPKTRKAVERPPAASAQRVAALLPKQQTSTPYTLDNTALKQPCNTAVPPFSSIVPTPEVGSRRLRVLTPDRRLTATAVTWRWACSSSVQLCSCQVRPLSVPTYRRPLYGSQNTQIMTEVYGS